MLQKPHGENMWRGKALRLQGEREGGEPSHPSIPVEPPDGSAPTSG